MPTANMTAGLIPHIIELGKTGDGDHVAVPGAAAPNAAVGVAAARSAAEVAGQKAAGSVRLWSDTRPMSEQMAAYPATCLLAAAFLAVSEFSLGFLVVCFGLLVR